MRLLGILVVAFLAVLIVTVMVQGVLAYRGWRRRSLHARARWVDVISTHENNTYVSVQKVVDTITGRHVLDEQHIGFVSHNNPMWDEIMREYRTTAYSRAIDLNTPSLTD